MMNNSRLSAQRQAQPAPGAQGNPCYEVFRMQMDGALPEGFPYEQACDDPHFSDLCNQYGGKAAVAIYLLEQERDTAAVSAREEAQQTLRQRSALPVQRRANAPLSADVDCWQMTDEEFRAYDAAMKRQRQASRMNH